LRRKRRGEATLIARRRLGLSGRLLLRWLGYFLSSFATLTFFFVALLLAEAAMFEITDHPLSGWAMVIAALVAALFFTPLSHLIGRLLDRFFFQREIDMIDAMHGLGAEQLAEMAQEQVEQELLKRICEVSRRTAALLDERRKERGRAYSWPERVLTPPLRVDPLRESLPPGWDVCMLLPTRSGVVYLYLGPRSDGWYADAEELGGLESLGRFAAIALAHARLAHRQSELARMDSLARVAAQLHSHDMKNRLHDLSFLAHNIDAGNLGPEETAALVDAIRKVVGRMQTLMMRMADPQAAIEPRFARLDLQRLVREAIEHRLWPERIRLHSELHVVPMARGDGELLLSVVENLFDNAVQAMQAGGDLWVRLHSDDAGIELSVRDSGKGMSADYIRTRLFTLFASNKPSGLGIGLYLCRRIVQAHGGTIEAESPGEGSGCTFTVRLPAWQGS